MPYLNKSARRILLDCFLGLRFIEFELHRTIRGEIKSVTRWTACHILKQWNIQTSTDEKSCRVIWFAAHGLMKRSGWQTPRPSEFRTEDYNYKILGHVESVQKVCACKATQRRRKKGSKFVFSFNFRDKTIFDSGPNETLSDWIAELILRFLFFLYFS